MKKQLYIHIGHFKTGTTALQVLCQGHRGYLRRNDLNYPDLYEKNCKHSPYAFSIYKQAGVETLLYGFANPVPPQDMWRELFDNVRDSKCSRTLISSEEFMRMGEFPAAEAKLREIVQTYGQDVDVRVIAYLRPPGAQTRSWYNQLIKMKQKVSDFNTALLSEIEAIHYDYQRALAPWVRIFGQEALILRLYPEKPESSDVLPRDFLSIFDIEAPKPGRVDADPNPRMDDRGLDLIRITQNLKIKPSPVENIRNSLTVFMEKQGKAAKDVEAGLLRLQEQSQASLGELDIELGDEIDLSSLQADLPQGVSVDEQRNSLMIGFVMSELMALRRRVNKAGLSDVNDRLDAIEKHLGLK